MEIKNKRILEALQMQPLSQEEMTARHILGRLYGPIATCIERTRNDRLYNKPLWEKALKDEIFLEKVATKALFLELGHPADREETDMKQACACIPEVPKIVGDDLCAYVDILDTPNGRLLKTLVDYGFVPGISSRGSGDVMENNQVDPETFFLETWDIVQLPAVKKARLNVYESLDSSNLKLKKALKESYDAAKEEDKDTMKKALENLNIDIDSDLTEEEVDTEETKVLTAEDIPWDPEAEEILNEETETEVETEAETDTSEEPTEEEPVEEETSEDSENSEDNTEETEETEEDPTEPNVPEELADLNTVSDAVEMLQEYDSDTNIAFEPVVIDGLEYEVEKLSSFVDEEDNTLVIGVDCVEAAENVEEDTDENKDPENDETTLDETSEELEDTSESAEDDGDVEVIESLKEMIRQKEALETEVSNLRKAKTVGDAKETELQEKLDRYRRAFKQATAEATKVPELESKLKDLTEQLTQAKTTVKTLTEQVNKTQQLKESADSKTEKIGRLNEEITKLTQKSKTLEAKLEGQTKQFNQKLQERTDLARTYKMRFIETLTKYIESKASMLGVQPSEITSRLNENYTLADVDAVCEQILDSTISFSRLPFGGRTQASARISESVHKQITKNDPEYGYEIDDSLLELAGLKN